MWTVFMREPWAWKFHAFLIYSYSYIFYCGQVKTQRRVAAIASRASLDTLDSAHVPFQTASKHPAITVFLSMYTKSVAPVA